jgi:hypothetical protein
MSNSGTISLNGLTALEASKFACCRVDGIVHAKQEYRKESLLGITSSEETHFMRHTAAPISAMVMSKILEDFQCHVWDKMMAGRAPDLPFVQYTMDLLSKERNFIARKCLSGQYSKRTLKLRLGGNDMKIEYAKNTVEQTISLSNRIFRPHDPNNQFVDFAYSTNKNGNVHMHVFRATTGTNDISSDNAIQDFLKQVGSCGASVYYLVLPGNFDKFSHSSLDSQISSFVVEIPVPKKCVPGNRI